MTYFSVWGKILLTLLSTNSELTVYNHIAWSETETPADLCDIGSMKWMFVSVQKLNEFVK